MQRVYGEVGAVMFEVNITDDWLQLRSRRLGNVITSRQSGRENGFLDLDITHLSSLYCIVLLVFR